MIRSLNFYRGLAVGAGLMYLLDPERGRNRRALLRDKVADALSDSRDFVGEGVRDLRHRAEDAAGSTSRPDSSQAGGESIAQRVRAKLGRYVSHPGAIRVEARDGSVTLTGPVLRGEAETLIGAVSSVRGVREVLNRLEPHDAEERVPRLWGGGRRHESLAGLPSVTPGLQLLAGVLGATAVAYGAGRIAARVRTARREELEREMPEYAMLR